MIDETTKKYILSSIFKKLGGISSRDYQVAVWIHGEGPEVDDYDETVNNFLEDCEWALQEWKAFGLNKSQHAILKKFHDQFLAFSRTNHCIELFIDTPEWKEIMEMAKEVLVAFDKRVS